MKIKEYLYVDEGRLDMYVSQIENGLATYDKVPVYSASLALTGPKAGAQQQRIKRDRTFQEKLDLLEKHLRKHEQIDVLDAVFEKVCFDGTKITIPKSVIPNPDGLPQLTFWVGDVDLNGMFLLEQHGAYDGEYTPVTVFSGLSFVLCELKISSSIELPESDKERWNAEVAPADFFKSIGAIVSPPRKIETLCRLRRTGGIDSPTPGMMTALPPFRATIAYAICIAEANE